MQSRRGLPFLPWASAIVVVVGVAVAVSIALLGVSRIREESDQAAALRAKVLATALAERLRATPEEDRTEVVERAASRSGAELLLATQDGRILVDGTLQTPAREKLVGLLIEGQGETVTELGRVRFYSAPLAAPLEHVSLLSFVRAPETPFGSASLVNSVAVLAALLIGIAAVVGFALTRDVLSDLIYVRQRITVMAETQGDSLGSPIPVRSVDQVGLLTSAFNVLVERFNAAQQAYRHDLDVAKTHDRDRSAFLAALSHELRTPLNTILGFTDVLLAEVDGPLSDEARENLEIVWSSGQHLKQLIDDILDLSALESGELRLNRDRVDVYKIATEVVREGRIAAQDKPLDVRLSGEPVFAFADALRTRQIIGNLVSNAVKFTSEGLVLVKVEARDAFVCITVSDTGPGIASDMQAAIFDEFQQAGEEGAKRSGTGLGLAITRRLVNMHEGRIQLESQLGTGSSFAVFLPLAESRSERPPPPDLSPDAARHEGAR